MIGSPFVPQSNTYSLSVTTAAAITQISSPAPNSFRFRNKGSVDVYVWIYSVTDYVNAGNAVPSGFGVPSGAGAQSVGISPGAIEVLSFPRGASPYIAYITSTSTSILEVTAGEGV